MKKQKGVLFMKHRIDLDWPHSIAHLRKPPVRCKDIVIAISLIHAELMQ